jgi:polyphosphate kinase
VEVLFPVQNAGLRERIVHDILHIQLRDTVNAWRANNDGTYERIVAEGEASKFDSQAWSMTHGME